MPDVTWSLNQGASAKVDTTAFDTRVRLTDTLYETITGTIALCSTLEMKGKLDKA